MAEQQNQPIFVQQEQEEQPQQYPYMFKKEDKADLLDKIRPDAIVEVMRHKLMGEDFINGKWVMNTAVKDKAITAIGAWQISNLMLGVSSQNVALSNLSDKDIKCISLRTAKTAQYMAIKNWKEYGIQGADQLHYIHDIVFNNTFITLKQPEGAGIRRLIMGTQTELRTYSTAQQQNDSWWSSIWRSRQRR